jgi:hypothetical protein
MSQQHVVLDPIRLKITVAPQTALRLEVGGASYREAPFRKYARG